MRKILLMPLLLLPFMGVHADGAADQTDYRRSSLYNMMVSHRNEKFANEISSVFLQIPALDRYNDHNLSVRIVSVDSKDDCRGEIEDFIRRNHVASRMVSRWFNRNPLTGVCDVELVKSRGLYSASEFDKALAAQSQRGKALLEDAGEELIGHTFLIVNDIEYLDREKTGRALGAGMRLLGAIADVAVGRDPSSYDSFSNLGDDLGMMMETLKGFKVKVRSYLYRLVWDEETSMTFYKDYYASSPDADRVRAFEANRDKFRLEYVGEQRSSGKNVSFIGVNLDYPEIMIRKACQRAMDENVCSLQKNFEEFKVKVPLNNVSPIRAAIGMKEGVTEDSRFEVLEAVKKDDRIVYNRVGIIKPVPTMIWDNRYMALEEGAAGADLGATTFRKVSGRNFYPGMLIREIR